MARATNADRSLSHRMAVAEEAVARQTEDTIQRCRTWCVVVALVQTAIFHGAAWWVGWLGVLILVATCTWTRWALLAERSGDRLPLLGTVTMTGGSDFRERRMVGPSLAVIGAVSMAGDALASVVILANFQTSPNDPVQLLTLLLVLEAAVRWGPRGGIPGGLLAGLVAGAWTWSVHRRNDLPLPVAFVTFRIAILVLVGSMLGSIVRQGRQQRRAANAVFNASRDLVATFSLEGDLRSVNPACEAILGYTPEEMLGRDRSFLLDPDDRPFGPPDLDLYRREGAQLVEIRAVHKDGRLVWIELDLLPDLRAGLIYAIGRDVSDRRRQESELRHRVDHDALTGVWNRDAMVAYVARMIDRGYRPAMLFLDLDRFKAVNDSNGHVAGDRVLAAVAERLCVGAGQDGAVCRYAGDEFCIVVDDPDDVDAVLARVREALAEPVDIGNRRLPITASIGVADCRSDDTPESLIDRADRAMYASKATPPGVAPIAP